MSEPMKINIETFWSLIDQAKEHQGGPNEWLMEQLVGMGPEQAKNFDNIASAYIALAYQYGLWTAASVMDRFGCSDDGFIDFRAWLVGQGREVYMAALKDPDSLADAPDYRECQYGSLPYMGDRAYEELTGRNVYQDFDPKQYQALKAELKKDIVYGDGIGYPYDQKDIPKYVPRLCAKYMTAEEVRACLESQGSTWNPTVPEIQAARRTVQKSERVTGQNVRRSNRNER